MKHAQRRAAKDHLDQKSCKIPGIFRIFKAVFTSSWNKKDFYTVETLFPRGSFFFLRESSKIIFAKGLIFAKTYALAVTVSLGSP